MAGGGAPSSSGRYDHYENVLTTLQLGGLPALLGALDHERQKQVAA